MIQRVSQSYNLGWSNDKIFVFNCRIRLIMFIYLDCKKEGWPCKDKAECCDSKMDCTTLEVTYTRCLALDSRGNPLYPPRLRDEMNFYE